MRGKQISFYLITVSLFLGIISPNLLSDGMFMDGIYYATISKNLANNLGSLWDLHFSNTIFPHFNEHPPLAFWLQGFFFQILGDSILVERIYSLGTFFITGFIIIRIWKSLTDVHFHQFAWLPLLLWITIPLVTWSASNNMLENTMMIFTSLSVLFILKSLESRRLAYLTLSGLALFCAFLTKGFVGLFPLSLLFWIFIFNPDINFKRFFTDSFILLVATLLPFLVLFITVPESMDSLTEYFNNQVADSIRNVKTVNSRFYIIGRLLRELIPMGSLVIILYFFSRKLKMTYKKNKWFFIFLFLGLSGVIPIVISLKQRGFYVLATFPIFSIAISLLMVPYVKHLISKLNVQHKFLSIFSKAFLLLGIVLVVANISRIGRDKEKIKDIYSIIEIIGDNSIISIEPKMQTDWSLHGYFARYANISLDANSHYDTQFFLIRKGSDNELLLNYKKNPVHLNLYELYEKDE
jgi:4-amino-4-deoxy-L-arabinose transferase-like glycosyltransferase